MHRVTFDNTFVEFERRQDGAVIVHVSEPGERHLVVTPKEWQAVVAATAPPAKPAPAAPTKRPPARKHANRPTAKE